jgi:hypothetical protein
MWIDVALYTSTFAVFLIMIFIIIYILKSRELQSKLDIYESIIESVNQDIAILKKAVKSNSQPSNVNLGSIDKRIKDIAKQEINHSLIPIADFVKNFSVSFKGFENRIDEKINSITTNNSSFQDEDIIVNDNPNKLSAHQVISDMHQNGLSIEEIEAKTGTPASEIKFILSFNGDL